MNKKKVSENQKSFVQSPGKKRLFFHPLLYLAGGMVLLPAVLLFRYFEEERKRW